MFPVLHARSVALGFVIMILCATNSIHAAITWTGSVSPSNPASWDAITYGYVGEAAPGTITVDGGSDLRSKYGDLGYGTNAPGTVIVTGVGSSWVNDYLQIGNSSKGTLNIESGGKVYTKKNVYMGLHSGVTGTATVMGTDSLWTISEYFSLGYFGKGTLDIKSGGKVNTGNSSCFLGYSDGCQGVATVSGTGSKWTANSSFYIGYSGRGILNLEAGGQFSNSHTTYIGFYPDSYGTVTVTGVGSTLTNSVPLHIGDSGYGTLNIGSGNASGGLVKASLIMAQGTGTGVCNLNGGTLQAALISSGVFGSSTLNWIDGTIQNYDASYDLTIQSPINLRLFATGIHAFNIDADRIGTVDAIMRDATSGGTLTKKGLGLLTLTAVNTYSGDTSIEEGVLSISKTYLNDFAGIHIASGAKFDLKFAGSDTVGSLYLDGIQMALGTWGSSSSSAANIDNVHFSGTGMLNVVPEPSILVLLGMSAMGMLVCCRRRR